MKKKTQGREQGKTEKEADKGSEGVGSKWKGGGGRASGRWGGSKEHRVLSLFVGKRLGDGSLVTEFVLIHQSQKKQHQPLMCVCVCISIGLLV